MKRMLLVLALLLVPAPAFAAHGGKHVHVTINGLVCDFCARSMEKVFSKKEPVSGVKVDLTSKVVTIDLKEGAALSDDDITSGITDAGYTIVKIERD